MSHSNPDLGQKLFSRHKNLKVSHLVKSLFIRKVGGETNEKEGRKRADDNSSPRSGMSLICCISCALKKSEGERIKRLGLSPGRW